MTKPVDPQGLVDVGALARVTTLEGLSEVLRARRQSLGLSQFDLEQIAGLAAGVVPLALRARPARVVLRTAPEIDSASRWRASRADPLV